MAEKKELYFGEGLLLGFLLDRKRITIRKYRPEAHDFRANEEVTGIFKEPWGAIAAPVVMTRDTVIKPFRDITIPEVRADGFTGKADAYNGLLKYYPDLRLDDTMALLWIRPKDPEAGAQFLDWLRKVGNSLAFSGYTAEALGLLTPPKKQIGKRTKK